MSIRIICSVLLFNSLFVIHTAQAQFIAYSQYNNTPLLTNPGRASLTDYAQLTFQYRRARVADYQLPAVSVVLPFFRQSDNLRYGGVGLNVISQRSGPNGLYKITGTTATFAYTIHLSNTSHIGAGISGGVINKRIDASALTTDSQYNFGAYDPSLANGENFQSYSVTRPVINAGFCWVLTDTDQREKASFGIAAYTINRPSFDLLQDAARERVTYIVTGAVELIKRERVSVSPTFRYINDGTSTANLGMQVTYAPHLNTDLLTAGMWYKTTRAMVAGLQYEHKSWVVAASMDFSVATENSNVNNAFELSLGWRLNRKERRKRNSDAAASTPIVTQSPPVVAETPVVNKPQEPAATTTTVHQVEEVKPTQLTQEEKQLSEIRIPFQLGSETIAAEHEAFLNQLVTALNNHPDYQLKITGHTCTVGDKLTNEKVSRDRAEAVARDLIAKGVSEDQLIIVGLDFQQPVAGNDTEAGRQQNRRVEFEWIKK